MWTSNNTAAATVDAAGVVSIPSTFTGDAYVLITATYTYKRVTYTATTVVHVVCPPPPPPCAIVISPANSTITRPPGQSSVQLTVSVWGGGRVGRKGGVAADAVASRGRPAARPRLFFLPSLFLLRPPTSLAT